MHNSESDFPRCLIYKNEAGGCSPIWVSPPTGIFARLNLNQAGGLYLFGRCYDYRNTR